MKSFLFGLVMAGVLIVGVVALMNRPASTTSKDGVVQNVTIQDGQQVVMLNAKGGYSPRVSIAKAGLPTTLRMTTSGTFDCSSSVVIPSLNYRTNLQPTGSVDIPVPPQEAGTKLQGLCSMGMYSFVVEFE